jgi:methylated-DNA-[protein]-cysteine S-methyltransferase
MNLDIEKALRGAAPTRPGASDEAAARFLRRAGDEGLVDVAYTYVDSPLGRLFAAKTPRGLVRLSYPGFHDQDDELETLASTVSPRVLEAPARLDDVRRELDEYFERRRSSFDVAIDWSLMADFQRRILQATAAIPFGQHASYGEVAERAGNPRAYRAAGTALGRNPMPIVIPCHRVWAAGGKLGGYTGGIERKRALLELEGALTSRLGE